MRQWYGWIEKEREREKEKMETYRHGYCDIIICLRGRVSPESKLRRRRRRR